ncbi:MAG: hypothetical protein AAF355_05845 [Myxococcota bacterium]
MSANRMFLSQDALDAWLSEERATVNQDVMMVQDGLRLILKSAVHFVEEVTGSEDLSGLVGKVKDVDQLEILGAEHYADSVVLGDNAYRVVEGFVGTPAYDQDVSADGAQSGFQARQICGSESRHDDGARGSEVPAGTDLRSAAQAALGEVPKDELDMMAQFFLRSR